MMGSPNCGEAKKVKIIDADCGRTWYYTRFECLKCGYTWEVGGSED